MANNNDDKQLAGDTGTPEAEMVDVQVDGDDAGVPVVLAKVPDSSSPKYKQPGSRTLVAESETVSPEVKWEPEHREYHDKVWGILYVLAFVAFVASGAVLVANSHPRYEWVTVNATENDVRIVSNHFREDVVKCCANRNNNNNASTIVRFDLCSELSVEDVLSGQWQWGRKLQEEDNDDNWGFLDVNNTSKYEQGDGMFDAFLEAPEIIISMSLLALFLALTWVVLLRFFAVPIVYATEMTKVAFFLYLFIMGITEGSAGAASVALLCAIAIVAWDIYTFKKLKFAGEILAQAAHSFNENAAMFFAFLPILILYAGNAGLFVWFFARSFEVVEVESVDYCSDGAFESSCYSRCEYVSPSYTTPVVLYLSLAYLWSVLLFKTMRLSIIATVIGSWHFHPEHQPGIARAIINTCTTSMGTLSVASLVSAIAEKFHQMFLKETMWKYCWNPIYWIIMPLYCVFGTCLRMLILMLTKFSVILHVFAGKTWMGSAKKVFKILKRHFKGGFVTEYASSSVLSLGSYVFSIGIYFIAWVWLDREFKTDTFIDVNDSTLMVIVWLFFALFNIWYPVLGLYVMIVLNRWLSRIESLSPADWVTPMAATFIACIAMMFFTYLAGIFLDTVDTLLLCFAIDRDNNMDMSNDEFARLVTEGVPTVLKTPDLEGTVAGDDEETAAPIIVTGVGTMPPPKN